MLKPAQFIHLHPAIQTADFSICRDPKMKAKKLLRHFSGQPFNKNHVPVHAHPLVQRLQSAHFLTDTAGTGKGLETGPRHQRLVRVRKG